MSTQLADPWADVIAPAESWAPLTDTALDGIPFAAVAECSSCRGTGEVYAGYDEYETGMPVTMSCDDCTGTGEEPVRMA